MSPRKHGTAAHAVTRVCGAEPLSSGSRTRRVALQRAAGSRDAAAHARPGRLVPPAPPDSLPPRVTTPHARLSTRGCPVRRTDTHGFSLDSEGEHHRCVPDVTGCGPGARDSVCRATSQLCISWPFTSAPKRQNPVTALKQAPERTAGHSPTRWHGIRPRSPS